MVKVDDSQLLHERSGHLNFTDVKNTTLRISNCTKDFFETCVLCKVTKISNPKETEFKSRKPLENEFIDILESVSPSSVQKFKYVLMIVDEYSKLKVVKDLRAKSEAPENFQEIIAEHRIPRVLSSDKGKEVISKHLKRLCIENKTK